MVCYVSTMMHNYAQFIPVFTYCAVTVFKMSMAVISEIKIKYIYIAYLLARLTEFEVCIMKILWTKIS